jgi:hypothetical protein
MPASAPGSEHGHKNGTQVIACAERVAPVGRAEGAASCAALGLAACLLAVWPVTTVQQAPPPITLED